MSPGDREGGRKWNLRGSGLGFSVGGETEEESSCTNLMVRREFWSGVGMRQNASGQWRMCETHMEEQGEEAAYRHEIGWPGFTMAASVWKQKEGLTCLT